MGRRLAEATNACRTRRTCGEIFLRFFLVLAEAAVRFLAAGTRGGAVFPDDGGLARATAACKNPSQSRKKVPAKTTTAKRRTQTLPTAGSWHPGSKDRLLRDFVLFHF